MIMNRPALFHFLRLPARPLSGAMLTAATAVLSLLSAALLLAGCATPGELPPARPLLNVQTQGATGTATPWPAMHWWSVYGDPALDRLVDQALAGQPSLQVAQARRQQARAAVDLAGAASRPQLTGAADLSDQRFTENGLIPPPLAGATQWNNSVTFSLGFAAVSLGVARATLDAAIALARSKHPSLATGAMRDNAAVQGLIGRTEGDWRAARAYLYAAAHAMWRDLGATGEFSAAHRSAVRLAATWTIHQCARVVDTAYHMAGATAVFRSNPFERRFRDMHAIAQQIQARDSHYEDVGKAILAGG